MSQTVVMWDGPDAPFGLSKIHGSYGCKGHFQMNMMTTKNRLLSSTLVLMTTVIAGGLFGCDQKKDTNSATNAPALPLTIGPATQIVQAPAAAALPPAARVQVAEVSNPQEGYAYIDQAYGMSSAIGEAPPDYSFDYNGVYPWVWQDANQDRCFVEPVEDGFRFYYYRPGSSEPYLVRDPQYAYGFSGGILIAVYDEQGRLLPPEYVNQRADDASRYLARARALYEASLRNERRSVNAAKWAARRAEINSERARWEAEQSQQVVWRAYHAQHETEEQAYWQREQDRRSQYARAFDDWNNRGFQGPPPPPINNNQDHHANLPQFVPVQAYSQQDRQRGQTAQPSEGAQHPSDGQKTLSDQARPLQTQQQQSFRSSRAGEAAGVRPAPATMGLAHSLQPQAKAAPPPLSQDPARAPKEQPNAASNLQIRAGVTAHAPQIPPAKVPTVQASAQLLQQRAQADAARAQQRQQADARQIQQQAQAQPRSTPVPQAEPATKAPPPQAAVNPQEEAAKKRPTWTPSTSAKRSSPLNPESSPLKY